MKLLDILARELEEWPKEAAFIYQDGSDGFIKGAKGRLTHNYATRCWENSSQMANCFGISGIWIEMEEAYLKAAEDCMKGPVTKDQWQDARAAYLEEQKKDPDGWIKWHGGECPVDGDTIVQTKLANGVVGSPFQANTRLWNHYDSCFDIVAYRLHREEKEEPETLEGYMPMIQLAKQSKRALVDLIGDTGLTAKKVFIDIGVNNLPVIPCVAGTVKWVGWKYSEDNRPPMPKGEPQVVFEIDHDDRMMSPQETAYAAKQEAKKAQHEAACLAEHVRREQDWANVLKTADPHAYLLGVRQYREGDND